MTIRVGILGTGWIAHEHAIALASVPNVKLVAVASATRARADDFAARHQLEWALSYQELIACHEIEAVHVCTRNSQHYQQCLGVVLHGKHVVAEKPLAASATESQAILESVHASRAIHACNFNYRAFPAVQEAKRLIESGELGEIHLVRGEYLQDWLLLPSDYNWRLDASLGGRSNAMADIGSHLFDLIEHVTNSRILRLQARLRTSIRERYEQTPSGLVKHIVTSDDCATVSVVFDSGALGSLLVSQVSAGRKNQLAFEIGATKGSVGWSQEEPEKLWIGRRDAASTLRLRDNAMGTDVDLPPGHPFGWRDALRRNLTSIYLAVAGQESTVPFATFEDGHRAMVLVDAALVSSSMKAEVDVPGYQSSSANGYPEGRAVL